MKRHSSILKAASALAIAGAMALGGAPAALAVATTTATSTPPAYCNTSTSTSGYFVTTDRASYMQGDAVNFCLTENGQTPFMLVGSHPWQITNASGTVMFTPASGTPISGQASSTFFTDLWSGMTGTGTSATGSPASPGSYRVVFPSFAGSPFASFVITGSTSTGTTTGTTTSTTTSGTGTTTPSLNDLITQLNALKASFPAFLSQIQAFIASLLAGGGGTGTTTPPVTGNARVDQNGQSFSAGGAIDFGGRGFNHEENVSVTLNGMQVATAHADGGGNFSTGSLRVPSTPGTYTYLFTGAMGDSATATITVR